MKWRDFLPPGLLPGDSARSRARLARAARIWSPSGNPAAPNVPQVACMEPALLPLSADQAYHWCRCGLSRRQPFCDGSHVGSGVEPLLFTVRRTQTYWLCNCKYTRRPPFCDAAHNRLAELAGGAAD